MRLKILILLGVTFLFLSCATTPSRSTGVPKGSEGSQGSETFINGIAPAGSPVAELQAKILQTSNQLLGAAPGANVRIEDRNFVLDCIGTVGAAYYNSGVDLYNDFGKYQGNGVSVLNQSFEARGALHNRRNPNVGDVIFWDNTWDRNGDGVFGNDPLTHTGLVVMIDDDGTITYMHEHFTRGLILEYMNLQRPETWKDENGKVLNSPLYMASYFGSPNNPQRWLAGDLWREFGGIVEIQQAFTD